MAGVLPLLLFLAGRHSTVQGMEKPNWICLTLYILAVMAAVIVINGVLRFRLIHEMREYIPIIASDPDGSVKNLSLRMGIPETWQ
ncbi:MAG: hypothetical protein ACLRMZ_13770 [Blautia marasmi]